MAGIFDRFHPLTLVKRARIFERQVDDISTSTDWPGQPQDHLLTSVVRQSESSRLIKELADIFR